LTTEDLVARARTAAANLPTKAGGAEPIEAIVGDAQFAPSAVRRIEVDTELTAIPLALAQGGRGMPNAGCTSGFGAYVWGTDPSIQANRRLTTAGHCGDTSPDYVSPLSVSVQWLREEIPGSASNMDVQWYRLSNASIDSISNVIWAGSSIRDIQAQYTWSQIVYGEYVCKNGMSTGYTCGTIVDKYDVLCTWHKFQWICLNYFVVVTASDPNSLLAEHGDSGGPVFLGYLAYGQVSYSQNYWARPNNQSGYYKYAYWPINRLSIGGLVLLTTP
jgi:hypothetical protein